MTNLQKAIELTGRDEKDLFENECPLNVGIIPGRNCDEQCTYCWEDEFYATIPKCFKPCECKTCQKYEEYR